MDAGLDTLAAALHVSKDDLLKAWPGLAPAGPAADAGHWLDRGDGALLEWVAQAGEDE